MAVQLGKSIYLVIAAVLVAAAAVTVWYLAERSQHDYLTVSGTSMRPTLDSGDRVKLVADMQRPLQRGDLVAVRFSTRERMMLKRVIALEGDEVLWNRERVIVNGNPLVMEGWPKDRRIPERNWKLLGIQLKNYGNRVPENNVIVIGDNTRTSYDSGDFGMLSTSQIAGRIEP